MYVGDIQLNGGIVCCGHPLQVVDEGGDIIPPDEIPHSEDMALFEFMFHSECSNCGTVWHVTAGKPIPRSSY